MSSWFSSFFRATTIPEETEETENAGLLENTGIQHPSMAADSTTSPTSSVPGLSDDQRERIREVLRRAEVSKQTAKFVVDPKTLYERSRRRQESVQEAEAKVSEISDSSELDEYESELIQMDSLPETIEVTLGPSYGGSAMSLNQSESEIPYSVIEEPVQSDISAQITRGMKLISTKIAQWVQSLDVEDDYITKPEGHSKKPSNPSSIEDIYIYGSQIDDYCYFLARQACILAIADVLSMDSSTLHIDELNNQKIIDHFAQMLTEQIMRLVKEEQLALRQHEIEEIDKHCRILVEDLFNWAFLDLAMITDSRKTSTSETTGDTIIRRSIQHLKDVLGTPEFSVMDENTESTPDFPFPTSQSFESALAVAKVVTQVNYEDSENTPLSCNIYEPQLSDDISNTEENEIVYRVLPTDTDDEELMSHKEFMSVEDQKVSHLTQLLSEAELAHLQYIQYLVHRSTIGNSFPDSLAITQDTESESPHTSITSEADDELSNSPKSISFDDEYKYDSNQAVQNRPSETTLYENQTYYQPQIANPFPTTSPDLTHIQHVKELAEQPSFEIFQLSSSNPIQQISAESSATSGADAEPSSSMEAISYDRGEPLLSQEIPEAIKEEIPERPPLPPVIQTQYSLTEAELAHIEYVKKLAEESSFDVKVPKPSIEVKEESVGSSATSGADAEPSSSMEAISYDRGEPLLSQEVPETIKEEIPETIKEEIPERPPLPPVIQTQYSLTEAELAHIEYVKKLAEESSFDVNVPKPSIEVKEESVGSSVTSGADAEPSSSMEAISYDRGEPLLSQEVPETIKEEIPERPPLPPAIQTQYSLTEAELAHIEYVKKLAEESSFDVNVPKPSIEVKEESVGSSVTSGADAEPSSSMEAISYDRGEPLLSQEVPETIKEEIPERPPLPPAIQTQYSLTEAELAHIEYVKKLAEESSFDVNVPKPSIEVKEESVGSSVTSGADAEPSSSMEAISYDRGEPLLSQEVPETIKEEIPERPPLPPAIQTQYSLTEAELAHIEYVKKLADESSFDVNVPKPSIEVKEESLGSSATSGADAEPSSSMEAISYDRGEPLLSQEVPETIKEEIPERPPLPPAIQTQYSLTEAELAHIEYVKKLADESSFDVNVPKPSIEVKEESLGSSATSGADAEPSSSMEAISYDRGEPLLSQEVPETIKEEIPETIKEEIPERPPLPPAIQTQYSLTEAELAHIEYVKKLADESSFDVNVPKPSIEVKEESLGSSATSGADAEPSSSMEAISYDRGESLLSQEVPETIKEAVPETIKEEIPERPPLPPAIQTQYSLTEAELAHIEYVKKLAEESSFDVNVPKPSIEVKEESVGSSVTSGADAEPSSSMEAISYDRGEPLLSQEVPETIKEEIPERPPLPPAIQTQYSLTEAELAHIEYVKKLAEESSFDVNVPKPSIEVKKESVGSSATSGADAEPSSSMEAISYDRGEPLLSQEVPETIKEEIPERPPLPPAIQTQYSLTEAELAHIEYVKKLAEESSFDVNVPKPSIEVKKESVGSSATSGADAEPSSSMEAISYDRGEPLLSQEVPETIKEEIPERPPLPPAIQTQYSLTEAELAHIEYVKKLADESSFDVNVPKPSIEVKEESLGSSATSGADAEPSSSMEAISYDRGEPLLSQEVPETIKEEIPETIKEEIPERPPLPPAIQTQYSLTEAELAHIEYVKKLADESSFDVNVPKPSIEVKEESLGSSATSGADAEPSSSMEAISYDRGESLLSQEVPETIKEEVPETIKEEIPERPPLPPAIQTQYSLTEAELAHIEYVKKLAEESSFDVNVPKPSIEVKEESVGSSVTSGADAEPSSSMEAISYDRGEPLLSQEVPETIKEEIPERPPLPPAIQTQYSLTEAELAHIEYVKKLADESSFDVNVPKPSIEVKEESLGSSATSGADGEPSSSMEAISYDRGEPLLSQEVPETIKEEIPETIKEEIPERPPLPPAIQTQYSLTEAELAHIEYVKKLADESSFDVNVPKPSIEVKKESVGSSATSGADAEPSSSMEAISYDRGEPLLSQEVPEAIKEEIPERPPLPPVIQTQYSLTEAELAHIEYVKKLADESSFDVNVPKPSIEVKEESLGSSATSGADAEPSSSMDAISYDRGEPLLSQEVPETIKEEIPERPPLPPAIQTQYSLTEAELAHIEYVKKLADESSFDVNVPKPSIEVKEESLGSSATSGADAEPSSSMEAISYDRGEPLLSQEVPETIKEEIPETIKEEIPERPPLPPVIQSQYSLTEAELAHIEYVKKLADESSFDVNVPKPSIEVKEESLGSSATSGADAEPSSSMDAISYDRGEPLLSQEVPETIKEEIPERPPLPPAIQTQYSLTEAELAHIEYVKKLADESSFDVNVPKPSIEVKEESLGSSATSGADAEPSSSMDAISYDRGESLLSQEVPETIKEEIPERPPLPPVIQTQYSLTEAELAHIEYVKKLADESSFDVNVPKPSIEVKEESLGSSATSGADAEPSSSMDAISYDRGEPLLSQEVPETIKEEIPERPPLPPAIQTQYSLTEAELAHIEYVKKLAEESSFDVNVPKPSIEVKEESLGSSATSGADAEPSSSMEAISYDRGESLLSQEVPETIKEEVPETIKEEIPERPPLPPVIQTQYSLTEAELAHIEYVKKLAEESSFDVNVPKPSIEVKEESLGSSATSGADAEPSSSMDAISYDRGESLLSQEVPETIKEEIPERPPLPPAIQTQYSLTEAELAHIEYVKKLADESSFDVNVPKPSIEVKEESLGSSATSGADAEPSSSMDAISYDRGESLLSQEVPETIKEEIPERPPLPPAIQTQYSLTEAELAHIEYVKKLADESSFDVNVPKPSIEVKEESLGSSATSGADAEPSSSMEAISYDRGEPLLSQEVPEAIKEEIPETIKEEIPERPPLPPVIQTQYSLTEAELAHIEYVKKLADESSFDVNVPKPSIEVKEESLGSSATSGADGEPSSSMEAISYDRGEPLLSQEVPETIKEEIPETIKEEIPERPPLPPAIQTQYSLTEAELAHIEYVKKLADESSFDVNVPKPSIEVKEESLGSSATSGADAEPSSSMEAISYDRGEPLLSQEVPEAIKEEIPETIKEEIPERPPLPPVIQTQYSLTEAELAHIEYVKKLADESSFDVNVPKPSIEVKEESLGSSATSGADAEPSSSMDAISYDRGEPLLSQEVPETIKEEIPERPPLPPAIQTQYSLTEAELAHIEYVKKLAEESSFDVNVPKPSIEVKEESLGSSATSGADAEPSSSMDAISYDRGEPLLSQEVPETIKEEIPETIAKSVSDDKLSLNVDIDNEKFNVANNGRFEKIDYSLFFNDKKPSRRQSVTGVNTTVTQMDNFAKAMPRNLKTSLSISYGDFLYNGDTVAHSISGESEMSAGTVNVMYTDAALMNSQSADEDDKNVIMDSAAVEIPSVCVIDNVVNAAGTSRGENPYSECEKRCILSNGNELYNVDFMVRLNFFAQRLTEDIAEGAANDLVAKIRVCNNPRARYFEEDSDFLYPANESSDENEENEELELLQQDKGFEVYPMEEKRETFTSSFMNYFRRRSSVDRPKSAMAIIQAARSTPVSHVESVSRRSSTDTRPATTGGDIMDLIRRSSLSSDKANESPIKLPNEALAGLSESEKEHILKVLAAASRSQVTPQQSRRSSSAMYTVPELESLDVADEERKHIEEVIQKAEQRRAPYVIKKIGEDRRANIPSFSDRSGFDSDHLSRPIIPEVSIQSPMKTDAEIERMRIESDIYFNRRVLERIDSQSEISSEKLHSSSMDLTPEEMEHINKVTKQAGLEETSSFDILNQRRKSLSPSLLFGSMRSALSKAVDKVSPGAVSEVSSRRLSAPVMPGHIYSPVTPDRISVYSDEQGKEFRAIYETDEIEKEESLTSRADSQANQLSIPVSPMEEEHPELTSEEVEHIQKTNTLAFSEVDNPPIFQEHIIAPSIPQEAPPVKIEESPVPKSSFFGSGFKFHLDSKMKTAMNVVSTASEKISSVVDVVKQSEDINTSRRTSTTSQQSSKSNESELKQVPELTDEEREHIARINRMAEEANLYSSQSAILQPTELTEEELEHIRAINAMADQEFNPVVLQETPKPKQKLFGFNFGKISESIANASQKVVGVMEVANEKITERRSSATELVVNPEKEVKTEMELTPEELEHIRKINEMAEQSDLFNASTIQHPEIAGLSSAKEQSIDMPSSKANELEPELLSQEEIEHIRKITEQAEIDAMIVPIHNVEFDIPVIEKTTPSIVDAESGLTEEDADHIRRIAEEADIDSMNTVFYKPHVEESMTPRNISLETTKEPELTEEELEHIRRIAEQADIDSMNTLIEKPLIEESLVATTVPAETRELVELPLTEEELEHIRKIAELAEMEVTSNQLPYHQESFVPEESLIAIQEKINPENESSISTPLEQIPSVDFQKQKEKFSETATKFTSFGFNTFKKARSAVAKAAEQIADSNLPKQPPPTEQQAAEEAIDTVTTTSGGIYTEPAFTNEAIQSTEQSLSEEEIEHIRKIAELADAEFASIPPTDTRFWARDSSLPDTFGNYRSSSEDSAVSLEKGQQDFSEESSDSRLTHDLSDYDMANEQMDEATKVQTFRWYEQQLSELNKSLDEVYDLDKIEHKHNGSFILPSLPREESPAIQVPKNYESTEPVEINVGRHEFEQPSEWEESPSTYTNVNAKIDVFAAAEADRALSIATGTVFPSIQESQKTSVPPQPILGQTEEYGLEDEKEEREESSSVEPLPLPPTSTVDVVSSQVTKCHEIAPECEDRFQSSITTDTATSDSTHIVKPTPEPEKQTMFGSKSKGGFGGFGGLSKFASDALKNAKQAGEQLGAKAAQAAQAASTGDLTQIGKNLQSTMEVKPPARSQSTLLPTTSGASTPLPPGLEDLSQEERGRILAVMACAEIDAAEAATPKISASHTDDKLYSGPSKTPLPQVQPVPMLDASSKPGPSASPSLIPSVEELGIAHLSPAEQEQILSVMRQAELQGASMSPMAPVTQPPTTHDIPMSATIVHEQLNDKDGSKTRKLSWENRQFQEQQPLITQPIVGPENVSTDVVEPQQDIPFESQGIMNMPQPFTVSDSGYATTGSTSYDMDLDKHVISQELPPPPVFEEISHPMLPESFEIDEEPDDFFRKEEPQPEFKPSQQSDEWSKPEVLEQYGGVLITDTVEEPKEPEEPEPIRVTEGQQGSSQVDAVELDEEVWMQPKHEYKVPENWEPKSGRMWTTVFSDDGEATVEESTKPSGLDSYISNEEVQRFTVDEDWSIEPEHIPTTQPTIAPITQPSASYADQTIPSGASKGFNLDEFTSEEREHLISVFGKANELNYEVQMDDPTSPIVSAKESSRVAPVELKQQPIETTKYEEPSQQVPLMTKKAQHIEHKKKHIQAPPEIKVTIHDEKEKTSDEESEDETPPSSDEDDYPDQIIEAPSAPSMSFTEMEHERETQSAFAQEVLQQIQSFGESANDEFEWKKEHDRRQEEQQKAESSITCPSTSTSQQQQYQQDVKLTTESSIRQQSQRINPFLESPEEEEPGSVYVEQNQLDSDDIDYSQAAQYYRTYVVSDRIEQQQQQRKINTIPEGEEEDNIVNTEGRYHAKELERKPLHGNTVPPLITPEDKKPKRRSAKPSAISTTVTAATSSFDFYSSYGSSQAHYISAGSSAAPTYTWATTKPVLSQSQDQQQHQPLGPSKSDSSIKVIIPETSTSETSGPLTPIRHAPPPPEQSQLSPTSTHSFHQNGHQFKTDIPAAEDLIPIQNHHPLHPHVHQKEQTPQQACFQHEFVPANSASDAAFLAQIGVQSLGRDSQTLGSQLPSANHSMAELEDDQITSRLKRSPAMILSNDKSQQQTGIFNFPPPTFSGILPSSFQQQANVIPDGLTTGVLMKRPFVRDEDVLLFISGTSATPTTFSTVEMGRRKLPSLPQPYMGTGVNAPVYYTSCAPEPKDVACGTTGGILFDPSTASTTTRLTSAARIQSTSAASSRPSSALGMHPVDPAIMPGATFKVAGKTKQAIIMPNGDLASNKQRKLPKMTDTMSRVMLKKELREVLLKRRDKLDTCEIEANHRQYVINRMLNSGLMPEGRLPELDEIPPVVKCDLPLDIVRNARIVPIKRPQLPKRTEVTHKPLTKSEGTSTINWLEEEGIKQFHITSTPTFKKSIAVQCDAPPRSVGTSTVQTSSYNNYYPPSTSLKQQIFIESSEYGKSGKKTVETQTDDITDSLRRKKFPKPSASSVLQRNTTTTSSGPDLLESTQRYFEEYDRRLREASQVRLDKQRFNFTDNDLEYKRQQILDELAQRREKISSMIDLRYLQQQPHTRFGNQPLPSSDYASTVPHYGSLPRIDYPARNCVPSGSQLRDFTSRRNQSYGYGSLPRNYERYLDSMEQSLMGPSSSRIPGNLSRSLLNLNQTDTYLPSYMQNQQVPFTRSANYIDQIAMDDMLLNRPMTQMPMTTPGGGNMLSQYANYLNNQFLLAQRDNYGEPMGDPFNLSPPMPPPMEDFSVTYPQAHQYYSTTLDQPIPSYASQIDSSIYGRTGPSQVYSRTEKNYGSRPTHIVGDYGNYMHNRVQNLRQLDNLQDVINHNVGVVHDPLPTNNYNPPTFNYQPSPWDNGLSSTYNNYQQQRRQVLNPSLYDAKYPREDGLTRMFQSYGCRQRSPYSNLGLQSGTISDVDQLNRNYMFIDGR